jgi:HPr kinase/phosphorylase
MILGASGRGKSALALQLIALGAALISDDRTEITLTPDGLRACCPSPAIKGMIEARGFGLLHMPAQDSARLLLALDLDQTEPDRLPHPRHITLMGAALPLAATPRGNHLCAAIWCHLGGATRDLGESIENR